MTSADHRAAGAPVRADAGAGRDVVDQLGRGLGPHAALRAVRCCSTWPSSRCRRPSTPPSNLLPTDLPAPPTYSKVNPADAPILTLAVTSPSLPITRIHDLVESRLAQKISQVPGVGLVSIAGGRRPAVRVQVNPTACGGLRADAGGHPHGHRQRQRHPGQGQLRRRPAHRLHDQTPTTTAAFGRRIRPSTSDRRLDDAKNGNPDAPGEDRPTWRRPWSDGAENLRPRRLGRPPVTR